MNTIDLPENLKKFIENDTIDFVTKAKRNFPIKKSLGLLFFGTVWTAISSIFIQSFTLPLLASKTIPVPGLVIGIFFIIGIGILIAGLQSLFQKGGFFIGTSTGLIKYRKGKITNTNWDKFIETIEISDKNGMGNIEFTLNTFRKEISPDFDRKYNTSNKIIYDKIFMIGVQDVFDIEMKCRNRIAENSKNKTNNNLKNYSNQI